MTAPPVTPADLHDRARFAVAWELDHRAVAAALQPYIWRRSWVALTYLVANAAAGAAVALAWWRAGVGVADGFSLVCLGMAGGYALLLPVHEGVHAAVYKALGAGAVVVRYQWRTLTAYCAADGFVVGRRGMAWVCVGPFVVLNPLLAVAAWLAPGRWGLAAAGALLLHVGACSGDFGLLNWLWLAGRGDLFTYDDLAAGRTYFVRPVPAE